MSKLGFALGTLAGMAINAANAREARAYELNEIGIRLANDYRYRKALEYFLEANELMPNNQYILNNIQICREALKRIEDYYSSNKNFNTYSKKRKNNTNYMHNSPKNDLYYKINDIPNDDLLLFFEIKNMYFSSKKELITHAMYYWSNQEVISFLENYNSIKNDLCELKKKKHEENKLKEEKIKLEQNFKSIVEDNYEDLCRIYSIPKLGKKFVIDRIMNEHTSDEVLNDLKKYK